MCYKGKQMTLLYRENFQNCSVWLGENRVCTCTLEKISNCSRNDDISVFCNQITTERCIIFVLPLDLTLGTRYMEYNLKFSQKICDETLMQPLLIRRNVSSRSNKWSSLRIFFYFAKCKIVSLNTIFFEENVSVHPSKYETSTQCWINVGSSSTTLTQH